MDTLFLSGAHTNDIEKAGEILRAGGLAAIPTETVYGLAANALNGQAVKRIYETKGRPGDNPLIVHICEISQWGPLVKEVPEAAKKLAEAFWPGPLTVILEKSELVPKETSGGLSTVAVRFPSHPVARAVIRAAGAPLAAPSSNPSGRPSHTTFAQVREDLAGKIEAIVDGGDCQVGVESTVITLAGGTPRLLRPGGITLSQLRSVLGKVEVDPAVLHKLEDGAKAASPGMKYKHYAPKAEVFLVDSSPEGYINYVNQKEDCWALCFEEDLPGLKVPHISFGSRYDGAAQAHRLFSSLYRLDELGAESVYAHMPSKNGLGLAVYNRLIRAAAFRVERPGGRLTVGLTGPSGSGKSTVGELLRQAGCAVIDCDALTRSDAVYDSACLRELRDAFGPEILREGKLDRRALAKLAFADSGSHQRLEKIVFPRIEGAVRQAMDDAFSSGKTVVVLDAPTLFESGLDSACARIIAVTAPKEERVRRICGRDGLSQAEALQRLSAQQEDGFYTGQADYVVENGPGAELSAVLEPVLQDLREVAP